MAVKNPWLNPFQRGYNDILSTLKSKMKINTPEITDQSEGNIFMIILSILSAIAEVIHYYIDNMARETFLVSARRYSSVYKHAKLVDYKIKCANPASVDLVVWLPDNKVIQSDITIPVNTTFNSTDGRIWVSTKTLLWTQGSSTLLISVEEKQPISSNYITFGRVNYEDVVIEITNIPANKRYMEGSMVLMVDNETWTHVDTFAYSTSNSKVFKVEVTEKLVPIVVFGNNRFGKKPPIGSTIKGMYYITSGASGNISENSFNSLPEVILSRVPNAKISQQYPASGGTDYETFDTLKENIPLSIKTLGVAITKDDYQAITKLCPGVAQSYVNYICGRFVEIYITPEGGGSASQALIDSVTNRVSKSKVITTSITVKSTKEQHILLKAEITGKISYKASDIASQCNRALMDAYNSNTSKIGQPVRISDIYALLDNLPLVDFLKINALFLFPQVVKVNPYPTQVDLDITYMEMQRYTSSSPSFILQIESKGENSFSITDHQGTTYAGLVGQSLVIDNAAYRLLLTIGTEQTVLTRGDFYEFEIRDNNSDIHPEPYSQPILKAKNIQLTVHEQV